MGKTHAYLHFIRLLHLTVQKLRRVDVYSEVLSSPGESSIQDNSSSSGDEADKMKWPVYKEISKLPLSCVLKEHRYVSTSKLRIHPSSGHATSGDVPTQSTSLKRSLRRPTSSLKLSFWAAYDTYHHCDACKNYREDRGPSTPLSYLFALQGGEKLRFLIPHRCLRSFTFTKEKQLRSLRLPVVLTGGNGEVIKPLKTESTVSDEDAVGVIKSPIMMPSTGRHEYGETNHTVVTHSTDVTSEPIEFKILFMVINEVYHVSYNQVFLFHLPTDASSHWWPLNRGDNNERTPVGVANRWPVNSRLIYNSFLQLFRMFDRWLLNRGWPRNGGSVVFDHFIHLR